MSNREPEAAARPSEDRQPRERGRRQAVLPEPEPEKDIRSFEDLHPGDRDRRQPALLEPEPEKEKAARPVEDLHPGARRGHHERDLPRERQSAPKQPAQGEPAIKRTSDTGRPATGGQGTPWERGLPGKIGCQDLSREPRRRPVY